ncbi:hypothetical protein BpHYR1_045529 [Brachionus plicatilis]|uniref:Uncharacterized protein n=1 Tax=Brachionus plicatilis TaxID=10195 RepID=A0A3M7SDL3_BRAPC|nr:hypothetical protein BpHYR1_045529 [Brachionus plicatilis]
MTRRNPSSVNGGPNTRSIAILSEIPLIFSVLAGCSFKAIRLFSLQISHAKIYCSTSLSIKSMGSLNDGDPNAGFKVNKC